MATRKSIEEVMNQIEDFLNSCKPSALSANKVIVPRDQFDELFGELKVKIPAEIDRCKKIMRNKEAILMDARKTADNIVAEATAKAKQMVSETEVMAMANQQAYETVEMARVQANDMLAQAVAESNEIRLGSMQYTNDIMMGIRNYVEATMEAEQANYENLITALNNDFMIANANLEEVQNQIVEFTGNPNSVTRAPQMKTTAERPAAHKPEPRAKASVAQKVKQAVGLKAEKPEPKPEAKPPVNIPDFITSGESVVPNETPLEPNVSLKQSENAAAANVQNVKPAAGTASAMPDKPAEPTGAPVQMRNPQAAPAQNTAAGTAQGEIAATSEAAPRKVKKKIVKKRTPVMHTPQTAQETVAKTLEAAAAAKSDKTVYKANGEQAREVPAMEGRVTRGPRVGRGMVEGKPVAEEVVEVTEQPFGEVKSEPGKSMGMVDDFSMKEKI
ncbi:MAG: hypothetical protein NC124_04055 [Clostridium sp.]|nr:hypothetical protein [Clostridium sp.]